VTYLNKITTDDFSKFEEAILPGLIRLVLLLAICTIGYVIIGEIQSIPYPTDWILYKYVTIFLFMATLVLALILVVRVKFGGGAER